MKIIKKIMPTSVFNSKMPTKGPFNTDSANPTYPDLATSIAAGATGNYNIGNNAYLNGSPINGTKSNGAIHFHAFNDAATPVGLLANLVAGFGGFRTWNGAYSSPVSYVGIRIHYKFKGGFGNASTPPRMLIAATDDVGDRNYSNVNAASFKTINTPKVGGVVKNTITTDGSAGWKQVTWGGMADGRRPSVNIGASVTFGTTAVAGTGFVTNGYKVGDYILTHTGALVGVIALISSDTSMTLAAGALVALSSSTTYVVSKNPIIDPGAGNTVTISSDVIYINGSLLNADGSYALLYRLFTGTDPLTWLPGNGSIKGDSMYASLRDFCPKKVELHTKTDVRGSSGSILLTATTNSATVTGTYVSGTGFSGTGYAPGDVLTTSTANTPAYIGTIKTVAVDVTGTCSLTLTENAVTALTGSASFFCMKASSDSVTASNIIEVTGLQGSYNPAIMIEFITPEKVQSIVCIGDSRFGAPSTNETTADGSGSNAVTMLCYLERNLYTLGKNAQMSKCASGGLKGFEYDLMGNAVLSTSTPADVIFYIAWSCNDANFPNCADSMAMAKARTLRMVAKERARGSRIILIAPYSAELGVSDIGNTVTVALLKDMLSFCKLVGDDCFDPNEFYGDESYTTQSIYTTSGAGNHFNSVCYQDMASRLAAMV